jgi:hypothetical protein
MWDELVKGGIGAESNGDSMHKEKKMARQLTAIDIIWILGCKFVGPVQG